MDQDTETIEYLSFLLFSNGIITRGEFCKYCKIDRCDSDEKIEELEEKYGIIAHINPYSTASYLIKNLLYDLPKNRDLLNPSLEKELRNFINE